MRKIALVVLSIIVMGFTAQADVISKVKSSGELVLGTSGTMTPMTRSIDDGDTAIGFDVDLANIMATALNAKLVIKVMPFKELIPALKKGEIDIIISNMTITPQRNMHVAFAGPYMTSGKCLVTKLSTLAAAKNAKEVDDTTKTLAVMKNTTSEIFVRTVLPHVKATAVESQEDAVKLVRMDKVQALMTDYPVCMSIIQSNPDAGFVAAFTKLTFEPIGIAVPAGDTHFLNWTNNFLQRATATGLLNVLGNKWLGEAKL